MAAVPKTRTGWTGFDVADVLARLRTATSIPEITRIYQDAIEGLGVFLVAEINDPYDFPSDNLVFGTMDMGYLAEYWTAGRAFHDPFMRAAARSNRPFRFRDTLVDTVLTAEDHRTLKAHAKAGMDDGYAFPMKGRRNRYCNVSIHCAAPVQAVSEREMMDLEIISTALYRRATDLQPLPASALPIGAAILTKRERECLIWVAQGKTNWDIAEVMGITERTVQYHVDNACKKLEVPGRLQAVVRAVRLLEIMI